VAALPLLLSPLHWEGKLYPLLSFDSMAALSAPFLFCAGVIEPPKDFSQDAETVVLLLDRETLKIPNPTHLQFTDTTARPTGMEDTSNVYLSLQIPDASALHAKIAPHFTAFACGDSARLKRPCYNPTLIQKQAVKNILGTIQTHVEDLVTRARAGRVPRDGDDDPETPFWKRFLNSQSLSCAKEAEEIKRAAAEMQRVGAAAQETATAWGVELEFHALSSANGLMVAAPEKKTQQIFLPSVPPPPLGRTRPLCNWKGGAGVLPSHSSLPKKLTGDDFGGLAREKKLPVCAILSVTSKMGMGGDEWRVRETAPPQIQEKKEKGCKVGLS